MIQEALESRLTHMAKSKDWPDVKAAVTEMPENAVAMRVEITLASGEKVETFIRADDMIAGDRLSMVEALDGWVSEVVSATEEA